MIERIDFVPKVFFFDRVSPAIQRLAESFKEKGSVIFFEPSSREGDVKRFNQCVEVALNEAQKVGAASCSYEGARGMMQ